MPDISKREQLAEYSHNAWSGWMKYFFDKCSKELVYHENAGIFSFTGGLIIPEWFVSRWKRQMNTKYSNLPESEKESDRKEANTILNIIEKE